MILKKRCIKKWKAQLDRLFLYQYQVPDYSQIYSDKEWLENYKGCEPQNAINDEVECWDGEVG